MSQPYAGAVSAEERASQSVAAVSPVAQRLVAATRKLSALRNFQRLSLLNRASVLRPSVLPQACLPPR